MAEREITTVNPEIRPGEEKYIPDPAEAEHMAYAEKPFREEASHLDKMAHINYAHLDALHPMDTEILLAETPREETNRKHLAHHVREKMKHLNLSADVSRRQANYAGEQAQKEYRANQESKNL